MLKQEKLIILRTLPYGDSDLIVHGLNSKGGQLHFIAKAALKSKKRFGGGTLEPTHFVSATYRQSREENTSSLYLLKEAQLIEDFPQLRCDLNRLSLSLYLLKLVSKFSKEGTSDSEQLYDLLGNSLKAATTSQNLNLLKTHFELKILAQHGILPPELNNTHMLNTPIQHHEKIKITHQNHQSININIEFTLKSNDLHPKISNLSLT